MLSYINLLIAFNYLYNSQNLYLFIIFYVVLFKVSPSYNIQINEKKMNFSEYSYQQ